MHSRVSIILFSIVLLSSCYDKSQQSQKLFTLLTPSETGVNFSNTIPINVMNDDNILSSQNYYNGGGVSLGDVNNDGLVDLYFTANKSSNKLYLNLGNMEFKDVTSEAGVGSKRFSTGSVFVDINNDGFLDIYVCNGGIYKNPKNLANQLYINLKNGKFKEVAAEYGINDPNYSTQATFLDYDQDGDLDLYILNNATTFSHKFSEREKFNKDKKKLRRFSGRMLENINGRYKDVTLKSGLLDYSYGLGVVSSDINNDGWPDLYIANDFSIPDKLFINNKNKSFNEEIKDKVKHTSWFSMGVDIADINNDGHLDIGVVDMAANDHIRSKTLMRSMNPADFKYFTEELDYHYQYMFNTLQLNNGNNTFSDIANLAGVAKTDWSWSALFADFDNDGYKDYFVTNGFRKNRLDNDFQIKLKKIKQDYPNAIPKKVREDLYSEIPETKLSNLLFMNNKLKFQNKALSEGLETLSFSNGASYGDLDNDGDLDLVVNNIDQPAFIYRNNTSSGNNKFLRINLQAENNSEYYNAKVYVYANNEIQLQEYTPTRGYQSSVEHCLHFGFQENINKIDSIVVCWIDGRVKKVFNVQFNKKIVIKKEKTDIIKKETVEKPLFEIVDPNKLNIAFKHHENKFDDFIEESLLPHKQSVLGPFSSVSDVNMDGLDDFYIGGAKGNSGALYIQQESGEFTKSSIDVWEKDKYYEDMGSLFFDFDNDGDKDLYVVSGGGGDVKYDLSLLQDRIYINNGNGKFLRGEKVLPKIESSGQQVKANDIDNDGDLDLFIGGRTVPGKYPYNPKSYILINENRKYIDKSKDWLGEDFSLM